MVRAIIEGRSKATQDQLMALGPKMSGKRRDDIFSATGLFPQPLAVRVWSRRGNSPF
jgi:hypothetical protein